MQWQTVAEGKARIGRSAIAGNARAVQWLLIAPECPRTRRQGFVQGTARRIRPACLRARTDIRRLRFTTCMHQVRLHCPLGGIGLINWNVSPIRLKVGEGDALLDVDRKVKRKQISGSPLFIDPNDKKHSGSTDDLYSITHTRNVQGCFPPATTMLAWVKSLLLKPIYGRRDRPPQNSRDFRSPGIWRVNLVTACWQTQLLVRQGLRG